ncbi:uncharacterized protein HMPREF1541_09795 [Cyphellophora europaea CBS 101466]|uniref:F-box domain-containing protein n=1 Tax=Cyphellophora europaea (strain CBS 101466) TaxID=1220924 RepID=W2S8H4_CYPE1|nr:uncharacterized protein HMPREF1541_09795 [Cyphellophora europaea CBS 101466]ETN44920.1 hypothetical protein HMPREF1541_09795 [Cyphellophora europaea CBS 101466]
MPLQSREVVTLRLILDCDCELDLNEDDCVTTSTLLQPRSKRPTTFLSLPFELRVRVLRYLLRIDFNRQHHTRRIPQGSIDHLLHLDSRRILEAPQFRHKSRQDINGVLPKYHTCQLQPSILRTCRALHDEGRLVLYDENKIVAIQCGIKGLGSRLRNYGIPVWGPFDSHRLITSSAGPKNKNEHSHNSHMQPIPSSPIGFKPVVLFQGKKSRSDAPFFVCSALDACDLVHALWIMVKCSFAKGMRFHVTLTNDVAYRGVSFSDSLTRRYLFPWMHNHIESLSINDTEKSEKPPERLVKMGQLLKTYHLASADEPNVYTYNSICELLEQMLHRADGYIAQQQYLAAESHYERICYEACSVVRTRTGKLVDVSTKMKDGINRVCKLIAISAFRLCELRSGAIVNFRSLRRPSPKGQVDSTQKKAADGSALRGLYESAKTRPDSPKKTSKHSDKSTPPLYARTTRLAESEAIDHALMSGLLALRLPCATPVPEWNIRLNTMLLDLSDRRKDYTDALWCIRRLQQNFNVLVKEARTKNKRAKQEVLEAIVLDLNTFLEQPKTTMKKRAHELQNLIAHSHDVARRLWGERLTPRKGYIGLIWTFRWA